MKRRAIDDGDEDLQQHLFDAAPGVEATGLETLLEDAMETFEKEDKKQQADATDHDEDSDDNDEDVGRCDVISVNTAPSPLARRCSRGFRGSASSAAASRRDKDGDAEDGGSGSDQADDSDNGGVKRMPSNKRLDTWDKTKLKDMWERQVAILEVLAAVLQEVWHLWPTERGHTKGPNTCNQCGLKPKRPISAALGPKRAQSM